MSKKTEKAVILSTKKLLSTGYPHFFVISRKRGENTQNLSFSVILRILRDFFRFEIIHAF